LVHAGNSGNGECQASGGPGYQGGSGSDAICIYCNDQNDGICADDAVGDTHCISNNIYDIECQKVNYYNNQEAGTVQGIAFDFCLDNLDNDEDNFIDFADSNCNDGFGQPTYSPNPVPSSATTFTIQVSYSPTVFGSPVTFGAYKPVAEVYYSGPQKCPSPSWNGNTATFTCPVTPVATVESVQNQYDPEEDLDRVTLNINLEPRNEVCTSPGDENNNGESDYDSKDGKHGDSACPLSISSISLSETAINVDEANLDITCTISPSVSGGVNSVFTYLDNDNSGSYTSGDSDFGWNDVTDSWTSNSVVVFRSRSIPTKGNKQIACGIYSSGLEPQDRSYQTGSDKTQTINVVATTCSSRSESNCEATSDCQWVNQCDASSPKYTSGNDRCVDSSIIITESCSVSQCGETCDGGDLSACSSTSQCNGLVQETRSPSCSNSCSCSYSSWSPQPCNVALCNAECNEGFTQDTGTDYCSLSDGNIYNQWEGCSNQCSLDTNSAPDTLSKICSDTCSDTDSGVDYTTQGTVTDNSLCSSGDTVCPIPTQNTDFCTSNTLTEYSCSSNDLNTETINCNTLDGVTANTGADTCMWDDYSCGIGACTSIASENLDCDAFDDTNGIDGQISDSEVTASSCTQGCSGNNCCSSTSYTSTGSCTTQRIETTDYIDFRDLDGVNKWGISAAISEDCTDGFDNDCNGLTDDQDPSCVYVTSISAPSEVTQNQNFQLTCGSTIDSNCVGTNLDSGSCTFNSWQGSDVLFDCSTSSTGTANAECYISNKPDGSCTVGTETSTPIPSSEQTTINVISSTCNQRSQVECDVGSTCEYCETCSSLNPQQSSGLPAPGLCVDAGTCDSSYQCRTGECNAECDPNTWANCLGYEECGTNSCGCSPKPCTVNEIGQSSTHGETPDVYICAGTAASQDWTLTTDVLTEDQYSCSDNLDNDGDGNADCLDSDCNGLTGSTGAVCCSAQVTCDALDTGCSFDESTQCQNDNTRLGSRTTYTCSVQNTCDPEPSTACTEDGGNNCCLPGQDWITEGFSSIQDIDGEGSNEICYQGEWYGADCVGSACTSTDSIDYQCVTPSHCSTSAGNCGISSCTNFQCESERVQDPITTCQNAATAAGYECAVTDTDPALACIEENPGEFNCQFFGLSTECRDTVNPTLGFDAGCSQNFLCDVNICNTINPLSCSLCYSQCINVAENEPGIAPFNIEECEIAKNSQWVNVLQCPAP
jgi:hypothetical protein